MKKDNKRRIRGSTIMVMSAAIFGMSATASAGNVTSPQTIMTSGTSASFNAAQVDPVLYAHQVLGQPYSVGGITFYPAHNPKFDQAGYVSWYGDKFQGKPTASGEPFDKYALTAAHKTHPLNSLVHVTNIATGKVLTVRINDRGPFVGNSIIDLSEGAAMALGFKSHLGLVRVQYAGPAIPVQAAPLTRAQPQPLPQPQARGTSILPEIGLPSPQVNMPQAYQGQTNDGDTTTVLTIKGPIHSA